MTGGCYFTLEQLEDAGIPESVGELDVERGVVLVRPELVAEVWAAVDRVHPRAMAAA